ncbi:ASCH domain-containing protein [Sorangium sp. So ce233]|uniref:ASCH domain-containing protein n=1 Tax=Sorangium sp. So ce233 TaxID=3133290 RepID=UPI003F63F567
MDLTTWFETSAHEIAARLAHVPAVADGVMRHDHPRAVHLAVLVEPYLSLVLDGSKTIESRFASVRVPPYRSVEPGDLLLLKEASGPIVAASRACEVWFFRGVVDMRAALHERFGSALRDDVPGFWEERQHAKYATLIRLDQVARLTTPLACPKSDRRGWVILRSREKQHNLFG